MISWNVVISENEKVHLVRPDACALLLVHHSEHPTDLEKALGTSTGSREAINNVHEIK